MVGCGTGGGGVLFESKARPSLGLAGRPKVDYISRYSLISAQSKSYIIPNRMNICATNKNLMWPRFYIC